MSSVNNPVLDWAARHGEEIPGKCPNKCPVSVPGWQETVLGIFLWLLFFPLWPAWIPIVVFAACRWHSHVCSTCGAIYSTGWLLKPKWAKEA